MHLKLSLFTASAGLLLVTCAVAGAADGPAAVPAAVPTSPAAFMPVSVSANPADNLPDRPGKDQIIQACSGCHQPDIVIGQKRDPAAWRELVDQMIARGANVEEARYEEIITYLAQTT